MADDMGTNAAVPDYREPHLIRRADGPAVADDIVTRLNVIAQHPFARVPLDCSIVARDAANEIERLRAAGDALAKTVSTTHRDDCRCNSCVMIRAWQEARHG